MIYKVLTYYDKKLGVYSQPIYVQNITNEEIVEMVSRYVMSCDINNSIFDTDLYLLGEFDDKEALFNLCKKEFLTSFDNLKSLKSRKENVDVVK